MTQMTCNGIQLEVESHGNPKHPAFILIRGLGTQLTEWHPDLIASLVSEGLHVVAFDNRDIGLSQHIDEAGVPSFRDVASGAVEAPYTTSDMAQDVIGLMDTMNIDKAHVMGISLGGMITQMMAVEHPERLLSILSVMSSSGRPGLPSPTKAAQEAFATPVPEGLEDRIQQTAAHKAIWGSPAYPESLEERLEAARATIGRSSHPDGLARQRLSVAANSDRSELLKTIKVKTTVIHGEDDALIPVECGIDTARLIPNAHLEIVPGMGHNIPAGLVPSFVQLLREHLARVNA